MATTEKLDVPRLLAAILGCELAGGLGAVWTARSIDTWYRTLDRPPFTPPDRVFGPVWTLLYGLMGGALYAVSARRTAGGGAVRLAQAAFGLQLALNTLWSYLFFGRRSPLAALVEIAALWVAIVLTVLAAARVSRTAALLLLPYLAWVTFAAGLTLAIWERNRR